MVTNLHVDNFQSQNDAFFNLVVCISSFMWICDAYLLRSVVEVLMIKPAMLWALPCWNWFLDIFIHQPLHDVLPSYVYIHFLFWFAL